MSEGTRNSVAQRRTNSPGALNVKADVKTREHDSHREHRMSREPPGYTASGKGYYFPNVRVDGLGAMCSRLELLPRAALTGILEFFL